MRYRPFTSGGRSSSAVSLALTSGRHAPEPYPLVCAALESGINTFSFPAGDEAAAEALRRAIGAVGRGVLILILRLDPNDLAPEPQVRAALGTSGATYLDAVLLDHPSPELLKPEMLAQFEAVRAARLATRLALACDAETAPAHLASIDFDILSIRYNIASGWAERNVLKAAAQRGLTVLGYGSHLDRSEAVGPPVLRGLSRLLQRRDPVEHDAYRFLRETPDWTSDQITLAFALTEPGLASVMVEAPTAKALDVLASVVERELPAGVAAQIEMARFAASARRGAA